MDKGKRVEQRKHPRFQVKEGTYAFLKEGVSKLARVIDISKGGLAFRYMSIGRRLGGQLELDLMLADDGFRLPGLQVRIISNFELAPGSPFRSLKLRRLGVKFEKLSEKQVSQLEYFITYHTTGKI